MACPLLGFIALTVSDDVVKIDSDAAAIRVWNYRGHDTILLNPNRTIFDRMEAVIQVLDRNERSLLVWNTTCTCDHGLQLMSA